MGRDRSGDSHPQMTRLMGDSTNAGDIPNHLAMVAGYDSGYKWTPADWALHPNAVKVHIATEANVNSGHVLDVERGDATPGEAPGWAQMRREAGVVPCIYMNLSTWPAVIAAFEGQPAPLYWVAQYDNVAEIPDGAIAKQYANESLTGGHYDLSIVADYWPGVDPVLSEDDEVILVRNTDNGNIYRLGDNGLRHIDGQEYAIYAQAGAEGAKIVTVETNTGGLAGIPGIGS